MDTIAQVCTLLEEKKTKFSAYEQATLDMLHCDADTIENYITRRGLLANEIDILTDEIKRLCAKETNGAQCFMASLAQINYDEIPPELHPVFELGQQVRSVAARIGNTDKQVVERLETVKAEALTKIKENQNMPKIKKYLSGLSNQPSGGSFTSGKA